MMNTRLILLATGAIVGAVVGVITPAWADQDPVGAWNVVEASYTAPNGQEIPEISWTLTVTRHGGRYTAVSGTDNGFAWNIEIRNWDFLLTRPWKFEGEAPQRVKDTWNARAEQHEIRLAVSDDRERLSGDRRGYWLWWNEEGDITRVETYKHELTATRVPPPTPADLYAQFADLQAVLQAMLRAYRELPASGFDAPPEALRALQYRLGLISRYLRIHGVFESGTAIEFPGPPDPLKPGPHRISRDDLFIIANAYAGLLQEPVPPQTGTFWTGVRWSDSAAQPIYFATEHEGEVLRSVLTYSAITDLRARLRRRLMIAAELTIGLTNLLPGGAIPELTMVSTTGRSVYGTHVGFWGRVLAVGALGLELLPVALPAMNAALAQMARRLPRGVQEELVRYLSDRNALRTRIEAVGDVPMHPAREAIQTDWLRHQDALLGRRSSGIPISSGTVGPDGIPNAVRGIDHYAFPGDGARTASGIVRELKLKSEFSGEWTRRGTGLGSVKLRSIGTPAIRQAITAAGGAAEIDQLSWPWILDRAIRGHRLAAEKIARFTGLKRPVQLAEAVQEEAAARDLIERFTEGNLSRQLCVMTEAGEVHARFGTLTGARANAMASLIDDIVPVPALQEIAKGHLAGLGN